MAFSSYASSDNPLPSASSIIASVLPSTFDTTVISNTFVRKQDLVEASKLYSLPQVDIETVANSLFPPVFLGSGASYRVYMRKLTQWKGLVVVKYIKSKASPGQVETGMSIEEQRSTVLREIHVLGQLNGHPNIVTLLGWGHSGGAEAPEMWIGYSSAYLIAEYAPLGSLDSFLRERGSRLQSDQLFKICAGVAEGVRAMHSQAIVHGDVKTANILIFEQPLGSGQYTAKISDLGYSISLGFGDTNTSYRGTDMYNAPEIRNKGLQKVQGLDLLACDVYSLGLLVWTVFQHGRSFLDGIVNMASEDSLDVQVLDSVGPSRVFEYALQFTRARDLQAEAETLESVLSACLEVDPVARLPISDVCQILDPSAPIIYKSIGGENGISSGHAFHYQPNEPKPLDVFDPKLPHSYELRQRIAEKLLNSARNPKHPKAPDLAYEASKCFVAGFGVPKDIVAMEYWLEEAARRGHEFALALVKTLRNSRASPGHNATLDARDSKTAEATTLQIKRHVDNVRAARLGKWKVFQNLKLFSSSSIVEAELVLQDHISQGLDLNVLCILHWAAEIGRIDLLEICLKHGANVNAIEWSYKCTPLVAALRVGQVDAAKLLLRYGACVDLPDAFGWTAGHYLFTVPPDEFSDIIPYFLNIPKATLTWSRPIKHSPVIADLDSIESGDLDSIKFGDLDSIKSEESPLSIAAAYRHLQAVEAFLFDLDLHFTAEQLSWALNEAVASRDATICDMILRKAFVSFKELSNPFGYIVDRSLYELILLHGEYRTEALHSTIEVLLSYGFDINSCSREPGVTAMCAAVSNFENEQHAVASALLCHGASLERGQTETSDGFTLLQCAIVAVSDSDEEGLVRWLLDQGAPFSICVPQKDGNDYVYDPLYYACLVTAHGAAKAILDHPKVDVNVVCLGRTPLHMACMYDALKMVILLLEHGADISAVSIDGFTPLEQAVAGGSIEVVRYFLAKDLPVHNLHRVSPRSILAFAVEQPKPETTRILQLLLQHLLLQEPDTLGEVDGKGHTILDYAIKYGKYEFALDLINAGANISNPHHPGNGWAALAYNHRCIEFYSAGDPQQIHRYHSILQALVKHLSLQNLIEATNDQGATLLHRACFHGSVGAVKVLLDAGALANTPARDGATPLTGALLYICVDGWQMSPYDWPIDWLGEWTLAKNKALLIILDLLLNAGADSNGHTPSPVPQPLTYAILAAWRLNNALCVERLCMHRADPNASSSSSSKVLWRALHLALEAPTFYRAFLLNATPLEEEAEGRHLETVKNLIRTLSGAGAKFDTLRPGLSKTTALAEALCQCNSTGLRAMLEEGVELHKALGTGQTAFKWAAVWTKTGEKINTEETRRLRDLCVETFVEKRKLRGMENLRTAEKHYKSPLWIKVSHRIEAILRGKGPRGVDLITKLIDRVSMQDTAILNEMIRQK